MIREERADELEPTRPLRTLGVAPSDYVDAVRAEIDRVLDDANGSRREAFKIGLQRMQSSGLITDSDVARLTEAATIVTDVHHGRTTHAEGAKALDHLYLDGVIDDHGSAMGTTMVGVMYSARSSKTGDYAGLMGMVIGGILTQSSWGALVGGLVMYWLADRCDDDNN